MKTEYFKILLKLSKKASKNNEIPVSALIVYKNRIIAKAYNKREKKHDICGHAEIIVIKRASKKLKTWKLTDCELYVSLKPCSMCENIINQSRIKNVYYLIDKLDNKKEYYKTKYVKANNSTQIEVYLKEIRSFFQKKRDKNNHI